MSFSIEIRYLVFGIFQKNAALIGIDPHQLERNHPFNTKNLMCFFVLGILTIFSDLYFIFIASTFGEYTQSVYITSMSNAVFLVFTIAIWQMSSLFQFIDAVKEFYCASNSN